MEELLQKECVSYNQAKRLRELGFNDPYCIAYYDRESLHFNGGKHKNDYLRNMEGYLNDSLLGAPTYQQAFRWIRETFRNHHVSLLHRFYIDRNFTFEESMDKSLDELLQMLESSEQLVN